MANLSDFVVNNSVFPSITDDGSNVGIGTAPTTVASYRVLHVESNHADAGGYIRLESATAGEYANIFNFNESLYTDATTHLFRTKDGSTEKMRISSSGRVGIGQASPAYDLDVTGEIRATTRLRTTDIRPTTDTGVLNLYGSNNTTGAANIELYGVSHATQAGNAYYDAEIHTFRDTDFNTSLQITSNQNVRAYNNFQTKSLTIGNNLKKNIIASSASTTTTAGTTQYIKIGTIRTGISVVDIVNFGNSGYNGMRLEFAMDFNNAVGNDHPSVHLKRMVGSDAFAEIKEVYAEFDSNDSANIWIKVATGAGGNQTYYFSIDNLGVDADPVDIDGTIQSTDPSLTALIPDFCQVSSGNKNGIGVQDPDAPLEIYARAVDTEVLNLRGFNADRGLNVKVFTESSITDKRVDLNNELSNGEVSISLGATKALGITSQSVVFENGIEEQQYNLTGTAIDPANGTIQYKTLSANTTFTESLADGEFVTLMIDDGTGFTVTWPTTTWVGGAAPTLATSGYNVIHLWHINGVLYGAFIGTA